MPTDPNSPPPRSVDRPTGCAVLVFALLWSSVTLVADFVLVRDTVRQWRALGYATVEGRVVKCQVKEEPSDEGTSYDVVAEYAYRVGGQPYASDRVRHLPMWGGRSARQFVADHPPGRQVTVYYDPADPADAVLLPGPGGQELFMLMFLTPFNLIMVYLGRGLARRSDRPRLPAGCRVFEGQDESRARLPTGSAGATAVGIVLAGTFFGTFVAAFGAGLPPPGPVMIGLWVLILGGAAIASWRRATRAAAGRDDLVIDHVGRALTLPETFGRTEPVAVPLAAVAGVDVVAVEQKGDDGVRYRYAPTIRWRDADGRESDGRLAEWDDRGQAEWLAAWVGGRCT